MSVGAAIAAMAEQAKMKACDKNILRLGESSDVFEVAVACWGRDQGSDKGRLIYLRPQESRTH